MNIPLSAFSNYGTVNRMTGEQQLIIWQNGEKKVITSPRIHQYFMKDKTGKEYDVLGNSMPQLFKNYSVNNLSELRPEAISPLAKIDGLNRNEIERVCIEHPDFFTEYESREPTSLGFDLEVSSADGSFPSGPQHPIVAVGIVTDDGQRETILWDGESDKDLILKFVEFVKDYDPDIIYGYNLIGYDIPQLFARAGFHNMNIRPYLNRDNHKTYGWESDFSYHRKSKVETWGRLIVDVYNFASRDYALAGLSKRLKDVSRFYGLDPIELDFSLNDILDYDLDTINEYVLSDCDATKHLFNHYFAQHKYIAEVLKVPLETYMNSADSFITKILQGRALFKRNILTFDKNKERHPQIESFQAAHIDLYRPGFHSRNYKVDFASMYPSIALALNLGPDTTRIINYEDYDITKFGCESAKSGLNMILTIPDNVLQKNIIIRVDLRTKSCLYNMCKQFKEMREPYKHIKTHEAKSKSNGLKMMVNTFYGANTNPYMSYGDISVGLAITGIARWLILGAKNIIQNRYGEESVVYIHTDGVNTNVDVDVEWVNDELRKAMDSLFPLSESDWISVDRDEFKEGLWVAIGNYVLRNLDGSLTKHGSTFKSRSRSPFYIKVLSKLIDARLDSKVNSDFIKDLYNFDNYEVSDFVQARSMNQALKDYKNENDLIIQLATKAQSIGQEVKIGSTFYYYKTNGGVELEGYVDTIDDIDIKYHWNIISNLLQKFSLPQWINKKPPLTTLDRKQQSLLEFV
tara:strand:- start:1894 stop:4131 length:2238 start_codon:yes stop_codon:yes gene_type:complete